MFKENQMYFINRLSFLKSLPCCNTITTSKASELYLNVSSKEKTPRRLRNNSIHISGRSSALTNIKSFHNSIIIEGSEDDTGISISNHK